MIVNVSNFDYSILDAVGYQRRRQGQTGVNHKTLHYADMICTFDIETTRLPEIEQSIMYIWQFCIDINGDKTVVIGRTWDEFSDFLRKLDCHIKRKLTVLIYVHNLSYEWQFLRAVYDFDKSEVFSIRSRKILRCTMYNKRFELRCSYLLTNMSLDECTKKYHVEHGKLSGAEFDYNRRRYPWTPLTDREIEYCVNDVLGLAEVLEVLLQSDNDNFYSIPYTSTGYVRRDVKLASRGYRAVMREIAPDWDLYKAMRSAFRGGNTHANRYYVDRVLHNVNSDDRSSSYPDVLCNCKYPIDYFTHPLNMELTEDYLHSLIFDRGKAVICKLELTDVGLKNEYWGCPYIPKAKCETVQGIVNDNGRVLQAARLVMWVTDVDYRIICDEYNFNLAVLDLYFTKYGYLPECYIKVIEDYYKAKTELKGVEGLDIYYTKSKNKLNSIYGMMATDPVREAYIFNGLDFELDNGQDLADELRKSNKKAFVAYAWGVWCTAWARYELERGIKACGIGFVYCDTDSVKYMGKVDFTEINDYMQARSIEHGAYATDPKGNVHYMGVYEHEGVYAAFKTQGAKKYAYIERGELHITIAGVNKRIGAEELVKSFDGDPLAALTHGFVDGYTFTDAGGLEAIYNDKPYGVYTVDGHTIDIPENICLRPSTYTLGKTGEYLRILHMSKIDLQRVIKDLGI